MTTTEARLIQEIAAATRLDATAVRRLMESAGGNERDLLATLQERSILDETQCWRIWAKTLDLPFQSLDERSLNPRVMHRVPLEMARRFGAVAVADRGETIEVAMLDPLDILAIDAIQEHLGRGVQPVVATPTSIHRALDRYEKGQGGVEGLIARAQASDRELKSITGAEQLKKLAGEDAVVQLVDYFVHEAIRAGASDVHVEPTQEGLRTRIRVDGDLEVLQVLPSMLHGSVLSRIKVMAGLDISERRKPQDGRIVVGEGAHSVELRVSTLPSVLGEKAVMRILDRESLKLDLDSLGFSPRHLTLFRESIEQPHGLVLITGPTGSGKSTTLYGGLRHLNREDVNVVTVEDPVEYELPGATQVQVDVRAERTFATALRSILRQDPDIVMIGEIRDAETAAIAIQAALTGHLVLSTLHTNDAPGAVHRLVDMGVERYLLAPALRCIVAQRLVARVCRSCARPAEAEPETLAALGLPSGLDMTGLQVGDGCEDCRGKGRRGRMPIHEVLSFDTNLRRLITRGADEETFLKAALQHDYQPLVRDGVAKAKAGLVPLHEVLGAARLG